MRNQSTDIPLSLMVAAAQKSKEKTYWLNKLSGQLEKTTFPYDHALSEGEKGRENPPGWDYKEVEFYFPGDVFDRLMLMSNKSCHRLHMVLTAAWTALLWKYTGNSDIIVATATACANRGQTADNARLLNTVLPLRSRLAEEMTFKDLVLQVKQTVTEAAQHQNYPFEILLRQLNLPRSGDESPLLGTGVLVEAIHHKRDLQKVKPALILSFPGPPADVHGSGSLHYNPRLYENTTIKQIITHLTMLLRVALFKVDTKLTAINILSPKEKKQVLFEFNHAPEDIPGTRCYHDKFETQVRRNPLKTAAVNNDRQITYQVLNREANRVAHFLARQGVKTNDIVAIYMKRGIPLLISILGIFKAGACYLAFDVNYPEERLAVVLRDSRVGMVITDTRERPVIDAVKKKPGFSTLRTVLSLEPGAPPAAVKELKVSAAGNPGKKFSPGTLAYIIYTSGTTGRPKGVMIHQEGMLNHIRANVDFLSLGESDIMAQTASPCFDISVWQFLGLLILGGITFIIDQEIILEPLRLTRMLQRGRITILEIVPSLLAALLDILEHDGHQPLKDLRWLLPTGEALSVSLARKWYNHYPDITLVNAYGPAEASDDVTLWPIHKTALLRQQTIPIGRPLPNLHIYILGRGLSLCPVKVVGEICIAGIGVGKGYLNHPEKTAAVFTANPYRQESNAPHYRRLYRTGDLGYFTPDGGIQFAGRQDHQVKVRGFRIELEEIESRIKNREEVKEVVVIARENENREKYLCAYIVPAKRPLSTAALREYLSEHLPHYMVPTHFVALEAMPLSPNGKIDRKKLPPPHHAGETHLVPRDEVEKKLAAIWSRLLEIPGDHLGIDDNFFELGGHSLKATVMILKIHKELNVKIPLTEIFKRPDIRGLSEYIQGLAADQFIAIKPTEKKEFYPLTSAQKRLYILQQMDLESTAYNMPTVIALKEAPDRKKLAEVFIKLIIRHEALRTSFFIIHEEPAQVIHDKAEFSIHYVKTGEEGELKSLFNNFIKPFYLSRAPLLRVNLLKIKESRYVLLVDIHHIVSDGLSHEILMTDFVLLYRGGELESLPIQYKDFSQWQNNPRQKEKIKNQEAYWLKLFEGDIPILNMPTDYPRPNVQSFEGSSIDFELPADKTKSLKQLAASEDTTPFIVLLAGYNILLSKLGSQEDVVMGTPALGRRHADLEKIIGMFVNTLALRNYPRGERTFREFLASVKKRTLEALENQEYPFEELVDQVVVNRDISRNPLFDVMFASQDMEIRADEIPMVDLSLSEITPNVTESRTAKFDLNLTCFEAEEQLFFSFEYAAKLFKKETIERFIVCFNRMISSILEAPGGNRQLWELEIISAEEKQKILLDFNDTKKEYPHKKTIHQLFTQQANKTPGKVAVVGMGANTPIGIGCKALTYDELNKKSNQLARKLRKKIAAPGSIVGIMADPSLEMIIGLLAILKVGSVYLPINFQYPEERKRYILDDGNVNLLLTNYNQKNQWDDGRDILPLDTSPAPDANDGQKSDGFEPGTGPGNLAYIIYTSGSTGIPKGVMVNHQSVVRLVKNTNYFQFHSNQRILQTGALEFDASTFEIWGTLLNGLELYITPGGTLLSSEKLKAIIQACGITTIWMTAPWFNQMVDMDIDIFTGLKNLLVGGDVLSPRHINRVRNHFPGLNVINGYGPTENTTFSTTFAIDKEYRNIPIGRAIANSTAFIVDKHNQPVPVGVWGELLVGGDGLARGYLNNPELTAEKFQIPNKAWYYRSSRSYKSYILYKTGDLARWLTDGNIEFLGRMDHQLKIRGFRIEPGEVENNLLKYDDIKEAVVLAKEDETGQKYLCAYIVSGKKPPVSMLRKFLSARLPDYMVPSYFVLLEQLPLTATGKIDREALPTPGIKAGEAGKAVPPGNPLEEKLAKIWAEVLLIEKDKIGIDYSFFQLGGHSLKATLMIAKIHKELDAKVPLVEIFKARTIRKLSKYIKELKEEKYASIRPVEKKEYYPLSSAQKRLYILKQMDEEGIGYNISSVFVLEGNVDISRFEDTFMRLIKRHESLRTSFHILDNEPVQKIHNNIEFDIEYEQSLVIGHWSLVNCQGRGEVSSPIKVEKIIRNFIRFFDLSQAPLLRLGIIQLTKQKYILMMDMHHIITDGTSMHLLIREFTAFYEGEKLPSLKFQYKDYSGWQHCREQKKAMEQQEEYWLKEFAGEIPVLSLPDDYPRPAVQSFAGDVVNFQLSEEETRGIKELALAEGATLYMILLTVTTIWLSKLSNREEIVIGTPIAARRHADLERIIGMFVNTLAIKNYPHGRKTCRALLKDVKEKALQAFENQEYPFEDLVEKVTVTRDASRNPLFDAVLLLQNIDAPDRDIPGIEISQFKLAPYEVKNHTTKFDLELVGIETGDKLLLELKYCTKLFKKETIERFIAYFKKIVSLVVEAPGKKLWQIEIISQKEKKRLLFDFNRTTAGYPKSKTIRQLFVEQAARTPDNTALIGKNPKQEGPFGQINARGEENLITYRELNDRTGQWAYLLQEKGVKPDNIVGIMAEPAVETIIALLGILKAGAAYLPIHPDYPQERIDFMMKDSKAKVLLTAPDISNLSFSSTLTLTSTCQVSSTNLAYVIYTSGTTGKPKGTLLKHENLVNYVHWFSGKTRLTGKDKSVLTASFAFDLGYTTIYPTLLRGAQLHILPKETYMLPESLLDYIRSRGISYLKMTPSLFSPLLASSLFSRETCQSLRLVVLGGEAIHAADVEKAYAICPHLEIMNHYGPTEVTIGCIAQFIARENLETYKIRPTIGRPIFNTQAYILDKYLEVLPPGAAGELCLSGDGPARGYLNNPELTAEKFPILNKAWYYRSYRSYKSYILYRTGDLARWLADGNIEFLGRIDQQIKIRGFRIELDEIEHQLIRHDDIKEAAVVAKTGDTGDQYLCAYIVSHRKSQLTGTGLTEFLSMKLPDYMIPPYFVFLDAIPLTPNGKIDRKALPEPGTTTKDKAYIAPRNQIEEQLVEIWSETLALSKEQISIDANFFQLGGHSLRATIMISRVHKQLRVRVPLAEIFKTPNIRGLAKYISGLKKEVYTSIEPVEKKEYYVLSSAQERLYILQQMDPQSTAYNMPQMIPLDMVGQMDRKRLERAIYHLIDRHENFRTYFEEIHEVPAQRLQRQVKVEVEFYDSIDPAARGSKLAASTINNFVRPFDLSHAPLLRVGLIEIHQPTRILMVDMHHIISDLLSRFILERDFISLVTGRELLPLPIQYKDYAQWRHHRETIKSTRHQKEYWLKEYEGEIPLLNLPMDYKRGEKLGFAGSSIPFTIDGALAAKINQCVRQLEVTMMMFLFSIYNILLGKYADQEELVMGTAAAGRQHADLENIIGFFVNMLAIKTCPHPDKTFVQYLKEVKEKAVNAYENQGYPFEELVSQLDIPRHPGRHPLVDAVFAFYNQPGTPAETRGKQAKEAPDFNPFNITHFDLMLQAVNAGDSIQMDFQYSTDLFKKSSIKELKCFYMDILDQVVENPAIELKEIRVNLNLMTSSSTIFEEDQDEWKL